MDRLTQHLVIISFDCLSSLDFPRLETLPNFKKFLIQSSYCRHVETIYPSVTYPCHATIVTGNYPNRHGIINNTLLQPGRTSPDWYWYRHHIQGTTLFDEAKAQGMTTAALLWPVTARAKIDYNMPEIFANRAWHHQIPVSLLNGSPLYQLEMNRKFGHIRKGLSQPELDDFVLEATVETIRTRNPQLLLVHFTDLDTQRHDYGFSSPQAMEALQRHDKRLGRIMNAIKETGSLDETTVIVLGDHSALDESYVIKPNVLFRNRGLLSTDSKGRLTTWDAYTKSCDGSAYVYIQNQDEQLHHEVYQALTEIPSVEKIYKREEIRKLGADPQASFMLEAKLGYYFHDATDGEMIEKITASKVASKTYTRACHGYSPQKPHYETLLIAKGKGIQPRKEIASMRLVDEGPTFARLLGLHLGHTDGHVITELLDLQNSVSLFS